MTNNNELFAIPAALSETMYAALDYAIGHIQKNEGTMSSEMVSSLGKVLLTYDRARSEHLSKKGVPHAVIAGFSQSAADKLEKWIDSQVVKTETNNADFDRWAKELDL